MPTTASDAAPSAAELPGPDRHLAFYGLVSPPFRSGADPGHLWLGKAHRAILDTLARAFRDGNGIAVLTGDAGTGKTSLAQRFIAMLGPAGIAVGRVSSPGQAPSDFFEAVLSAYGVRRPVHDKDAFGACLRNVLARAAARGDRMLLALDEAQGLGHELLREVGDLSALAAASGHPLFILLIGETRLTAALKDDQHAALRAHIIARCAVPPLSLEEVGAYVRHNLDAAGAASEIFSPEAIRTIASLSRGAPGAINIIGDRALLVGRARRARPITGAIVSECGRSPESPSAADTGVDRSSSPTSLRSRAKGRGRLYVTIAATALFVTGAPYLVWWITGLGDNSARTASDNAALPPHAPAREEEAPAPAVMTGLPADASSTPAPSSDANGPGLPERRAPVSAAPIEAHAAIPARLSPSRPRVAAPRENSPIRENPVTREIRPPASGTIRPPVPPVAATPERVPAREAPSPRPQAAEGRADTPDPSAIIDWLMKESPGRRPGG